MCGIVGWVDFTRDLAGERPTLQAMTDTMAKRGVDDQGLWLQGHAGVGHTRTSIIDLAGGAQPFVAEEGGRPIAVLTYNGEVYNFKQLRAQLAGHGHQFRTRSDTEVVLRAYLEWGADCAKRLEGIFAFAVWDPRRGELMLARDRFGVKPLFYTTLPAGVLFGSEPKALLASRLARPLVTVEGLQELFSIAKQPGQAVFHGMREVRPGHTLTVGRDKVVDRAYWALKARPHTDDLPTTISTVRSLLDDIVLRELVADVPLCTALSGGLDSSAITAIAARWRWALEGERVRTFVTTFDGYAKNFRPDDVRFSPDEPYAAEVACHLRADHTNIRLSTRQLMDPETRLAAMVAQDMPSTLGDMDTSNYLTSREIRTHSTVALVGEVSDEIFGGYNWMFHPPCVNADVFPWVVNESRREGTRNGQGRGLFDRGLMEKLDMPRYYADNFQQAVSEAPHQDGESATERRMRSICYVTLTRWLPMLLDRGDRLSMAHGLELRVPYCDHRLVEYLYNTPWAVKTFGGREKSILRAAVRDLLPASILDRKKSPWPVTQDPAYTRMLHGELSALASDTSSPVLPLLDAGAVRKALRDTSEAGHDWASRMNVEMALQFNSWLGCYHIDLAI
jgi:asparagine synthase (glutamine-hydrolysing)